MGWPYASYRGCPVTRSSIGWNYGAIIGYPLGAIIGVSY